MPFTPREDSEVAAANASDRPPVLFIHGLWLLANSWDPWRRLFENAGFATLAPGWPDDPETVSDARAHPEVFAGKSVGQVTDHFADVIKRLNHKPIIVGHSFGGIVTQKLAGQGLAAGSVAINAAPFRGVLALPISALKAALPVLRNPANRRRSVALTFEQFRYAFVNTVSEAEAHQIYDDYPVAGSGIPLFQAAFANVNPSTEMRVDTRNPDRGPLLLLTSDKDNTAPKAIAKGSLNRYKKQAASTELIEMKDRGHSLIIDSGWREVADVALDFLGRHNLSPQRA